MTGIGDEFEKSPGTAHDAAFRLAFRKKEVAESFFRRYLPEEIAGLIDFRAMKAVNKSFVDKRLRQCHADMVYETRLAGSPAFLYLLLEHQSGPNRRMPLRLLSYMVNLWLDFEDRNPESQGLPVIFPAVFHHGRRPWRAPRRLSETMEGYQSAFESFVPDFSFWLFDLNARDDESLVRAGDAALAAVLHLFKHIFDDAFEDVFRGTANLAVEIEDERTLARILEWAAVYFLNARNEDADRIIDVFERESGRIGDERVRSIIMTAAEQLKRKGMEEGRLAGLREGKLAGLREGKLAGLREVLCKLLERRFGPLSPTLAQRLNQSDVDALNRFGESIFDFGSLEDAEKWWDVHGKSGNA